MKRRHWLFGGAGAAAAAAGFGWQAWRSRQEEPPVSEDTSGLWTMRFAQPDGGELVMAERRGKPLLLNFWATWCAPCVKEMPEIDRFHRQFSPRGWQVVGLAIDGPTPVREYLQRVRVGFSIGLAGMEGTELTMNLGNTQGALPFTAIFGADGRIVRRKLGETSYAELAAWAEALG